MHFLFLTRWSGVTLCKVHFSPFLSLSSSETSASYLSSYVINLLSFTNFNRLLCSDKNCEIAKLKSQHYPSPLFQGLLSLTLQKVFGRTGGDSLEDWGRSNVKIYSILLSFYVYVYIYYFFFNYYLFILKVLGKTKGFVSQSIKP